MKSNFKKKEIRKSSFKNVSGLIQNFFENPSSPFSDSYTCYQLQADWTQIIGSHWATKSLPIKYQKGRLFIAISHSSFLQDAHFEKKLFKDQINTHLNKKWAQDICFILAPKLNK